MIPAAVPPSMMSPPACTAAATTPRFMRRRRCGTRRSWRPTAPNAQTTQRGAPAVLSHLREEAGAGRVTGRRRVPPRGPSDAPPRARAWFGGLPLAPGQSPLRPRPCA